MSVSTASSSAVSQFGLYRTIDSRTEEFLKLSKKRQIRQGCACAAVTAAITVTIVIVILLLYEYSIVGFLKQNWLRTTSNRENELPWYFQRSREGISSRFQAQQPKMTALEYVPEILGALHKNTETHDRVFLMDLDNPTEKTTDKKISIHTEQTTIEQTTPEPFNSAEFQSKTRLNRNFQNMKKIVNNMSRNNKRHSLHNRNYYNTHPISHTVNNIEKPKEMKLKITTAKPNNKITGKIKVVYPAVSLTALMSNIAKFKDQGPLSKLNCTCEASFLSKTQKTVSHKKVKIIDTTQKTTEHTKVLEPVSHKKIKIINTTPTTTEHIKVLEPVSHQNIKIINTTVTTTEHMKVLEPSKPSNLYVSSTIRVTTRSEKDILVDITTKSSNSVITDATEIISTSTTDAPYIFNTSYNKRNAYQFIQYAVVPPAKKRNKLMWTILKSMKKTTTHRNHWEQSSAETTTISKKNKIKRIKLPDLDEYDDLVIIDKKQLFDLKRPHLVGRNRESRKKPKLILRSDGEFKTVTMRAKATNSIPALNNLDAISTSWSIIDNYDYDNIHQDDFD